MTWICRELYDFLFLWVSDVRWLFSAPSSSLRRLVACSSASSLVLTSRGTQCLSVQQSISLSLRVLQVPVQSFGILRLSHRQTCEMAQVWRSTLEDLTDYLAAMNDRSLGSNRRPPNASTEGRDPRLNGSTLSVVVLCLRVCFLQTCLQEKVGMPCEM